MVALGDQIWVDPPEGWMYGFPKLWDKTKQPDFGVWLLENGYPQSKIEMAEKHSRSWLAGVKDESF